MYLIATREQESLKRASLGLFQNEQEWMVCWMFLIVSRQVPQTTTWWRASGNKFSHDKNQTFNESINIWAQAFPGTMPNDTIGYEVDFSGDIVQYKCLQTSANNPNLMGIYAPYAYELAYNCSSESGHFSADGIAVLEKSILVKLKDQLLPSSSVCNSPQPLWFAGISSAPFDNQVDSLNCTYFDPAVQQDMCCDVVQGNLTLTNLSSVDSYMDEVLMAVTNALIDSNGTAGYKVYYLGADLRVTPTTGSDNIGAAINSDKPPATPEDGEFTLLGTFVLIFLALTACGVIAFIVQRNRRSRDLTFVLAKTEDGSGLVLENGDDDDWIEPRRLPTREQMDTTVLSDSSLDIYIRSISSTPFGDKKDVSDVRGEAFPPSRNSSEGAYCFDPVDEQETEHQQQSRALLPSSSNERNLPRQIVPYHQQPYSYSIGGISIVPAYASEIEVSDASEIDSWAQTEATIGSLEERELRDSAS